MSTDCGRHSSSLAQSMGTHSRFNSSAQTTRSNGTQMVMSMHLTSLLVSWCFHPCHRCDAAGACEGGDGRHWNFRGAGRRQRRRGVGTGLQAQVPLGFWCSYEGVECTLMILAKPGIVDVELVSQSGVVACAFVWGESGTFAADLRARATHELECDTHDFQISLPSVRTYLLDPQPFMS